MNLVILTGPTYLAITYPHVGRLAGIMGAFGGFLTIYFLPTMTYLFQSYDAIDNPDIVEAQRNSN